ncbi:MAG TPA: hypothetical protein VE783_07300 [Candidatus Limnocylindrales bacterium]|jgi:membrane protein implicated in regulation of membrane protease activity|nr:hypothetical protein [Candidatus Limnocylindrales bacterium]
MNWELFYLICFVVGFAFSAISFLTGTLHLHVHLPGHAHFYLGGHAHGGKGGNGMLMFLNPMAIAVFLAWFGGTGYLLVHLRHIWVFAGLVLSSLAGFVGAAIVLLFLTKVLMAHDYTLDPADFEMVGVLGRVSGKIRRAGTGEIIFEQQGARKASAARAETDEEITCGEEVVVTRYEAGVAYVRRWNELADQAGILPDSEHKESL